MAGFGTDTVGFPGRYLEDDPLMRGVVAALVQHYGITVTIASNDGTRRRAAPGLTSGTVTVPASAFAAGGGVYGLAVLQDPTLMIGGAVASIRAEGSSANARPGAPTLAAPGGSFGHTLAVSRAAPDFQVSWDASGVGHATGASLEISAPGPTIYNLLNTFTNQNGTQRDNNGGDTGSVALIRLPGLTGTTTLDAAKHLFGGSPNNNSTSSVIVTDEHGNVLRRLEEFNFFNIFLPDMGDYVQLNPPASMAFTFGPGGQQRYPFSYAAPSGR